MSRSSDVMRPVQHVFQAALFAAIAALAACGGDEAPEERELDPDASMQADAGDGGPSLPVMVTARVNGLAGTGLVLRTSAGEIVPVAADGTIAFAQPISGLSAGSITVETQPVSPRQSCVATLGEGNSVTITCTTNSFKVGGTINGLAGKGLVLTNGTGERLEVAASGAFSFTQVVPDLGNYTVTIATAPSAPAQTCVVSGGSGRIDGGDVTSVQVTCTTLSFSIGGTVSGLLGTGLQLALNGTPLAIAANGAFMFPAALPDATVYSVTVKSQPASPTQSCVVQGGDATLMGAAVSNVSVVCGALGKLRISEISSCYYTNASCWFEVYNAGTATENLSFYTLRSTAVRREPYEYDNQHTFTLPSLAIPAGGYALVRGKTETALPDGLASVLVEDGSTTTVPWWQRFGFVELVTAGATVDFVRFGQSTQEPLTSGAYSGGSAVALPAGEDQHGYSLARAFTQSDTNAAADFALRAFATPGGPNDVTSDADVDADGIPDQAEQNGGRFAGLDLYAMGARTGKRDLFVEIDRMAGTDAALIPQRAALDRVVAAFAAKNIAVHFDVGSLFTTSFDPAAYNLGGGDVVPFAASISMGPRQGFADLYEYKADHMEPARRAVFHYMMFAWSQQEGGDNGSSGVGERPGNDSVITLGGIGLIATTTAGRNTTTNYQAATIMHELGHNLNLRHGGGDDVNYKPNYLSVMNYLYSPYGLPTVGNKEGDRYYLFTKCKLYGDQINGADDDPLTFRVDFSTGQTGVLDEANVTESEGLRAVASVPVDWDCDGNLSETYPRDLNKDGATGKLQDYDDWTNIKFAFQRGNAGNENGMGMQPSAPTTPRDDLLTDDVQSVDPDPCPPASLAH